MIDTDLLEVTAVEPYMNTHYCLVQESPDGVAGWLDRPELPIDQNPLNIDLTGAVGTFFRAAPTNGDAVPVAPWSNVVENI